MLFYLLCLRHCQEILEQLKILPWQWQTPILSAVLVSGASDVGEKKSETSLAIIYIGLVKMGCNIWDASKLENMAAKINRQAGGQATWSNIWNESQTETQG